MPYETYTNESDTQFARDLDRYKLGPGVFGDVNPSSQYAASEAALSLLPQYAALGQIMSQRSGAHETSMRTRSLIQGEERTRKYEDEFESFSAESQESYDPSDPVGNARKDQELSRKYEGNPLAMAALKGRQDFSQTAFKAIQQRNDQANEEFDFANRGMREQLAVEQMTGSLRMAKKANEEYGSVLQRENTAKVSALGTAMGSTYERDPDLHDQVMRAATRLADAGKFTEIDELTDMMGTYSQSHLLEDSYAPEIKEMKGKAAAFASEGIDLMVNDPVKRAEAYAAAGAIVNKKLSDPNLSPAVKSNWKRNYDELVKSSGNITRITEERAGVRNMLGQLLENPPTDMNAPEAREWREKKNVALVRMSSLKGLVQSKTAERERETALRESNLALEKKHLDNIKLHQGIIFDKEDQQMKSVILSMRKDKMTLDKMAYAIRAAGLIKDKNKFKTNEDVEDYLEGMMPSIDAELEEGRSDMGSDIFKKKE